MTTKRTPSTEAGRALLAELSESPLPGARYAHEVVMLRLAAIEAEARAPLVAALERAVPERLPSGLPKYDRERAAFNEGRAAVLAALRENQP